MFQTAWDEACTSVDIPLVFKQNAMTIKLDESEDHLVCINLSTLVMKATKEFHEDLVKSAPPANLKAL